MTTIDSNNPNVTFTKKTNANAGENLKAEGSFSILVTANSAALASANGAIASSVINDQSVLNKYSVGSIEFVTAFDNDVVSSLVLQAGDGSGNWTDVLTVISDTEPNVSGTTASTMDLRNLYVPQLRYVFNKENNTVDNVTNGIVKFKIGVS